jgi:hypothetical protein
MFMRTILLALQVVVISPSVRAEKPAEQQPKDFIVVASNSEDASPDDFSRRHPALRTTSHKALLTDPDRIQGYLVECEKRGVIGHLAARCVPLAAGQRVRGYIKDGKLIVQIDGKARIYKIVESRLLDPERTERPAVSQDHQ